MTQAELLQLVAANAKANIYIKDAQGRFLLVNKRAADLFGVSPEEMLGKTDYDYVAAAQSDIFRKYDRQVAESGQPLTIKVTLDIAGARRTFIDHKFPVSEIDGSPNAVGGVALEISSIDAEEAL